MAHPGYSTLCARGLSGRVGTAPPRKHLLTPDCVRRLCPPYLSYPGSRNPGFSRMRMAHPGYSTRSLRTRGHGAAKEAFIDPRLCSAPLPTLPLIRIAKPRVFPDAHGASGLQPGHCVVPAQHWRKFVLPVLSPILGRIFVCNTGYSALSRKLTSRRASCDTGFASGHINLRPLGRRGVYRA